MANMKSVLLNRECRGRIEEAVVLAGGQSPVGLRPPPVVSKAPLADGPENFCVTSFYFCVLHITEFSKSGNRTQG